MEIFRKVIYYLIIIISTAVILAAVLSLIHDVRFWYTKILDFPRVHYLIIGVLCLLIFIPLNKKWKFPSIFLTIGLISAIIIQMIYILPYYIGKKTVPDAILSQVEEGNTVRIMIANVLMTNKASNAFLDIVSKNDPDMLLAMEVDNWWVDQLEPLKEKYPNVIKSPNDSAYGLALYSKLPFKESRIMFLKEKYVPSIRARVVLPSGKEFIFYGVHPTSPVPSKKYPDSQGDKDIELILVGDKVAKDSLPAIVAGDFNTVSWSNTSRLFESSGNLNNVRIGRGLYNTFDATSMIIRWPLDHFFVTQEFSVLELGRLPKFNSDHFPLYAEFVLN